MFKNYKGIFKGLRDMQDRMWRENSPRVSCFHLV
jgi:hypothetical protein